MDIAHDPGLSLIADDGTTARAALIGRVRALVPTIQARAVAHDADGSFPAEDFAALRAAGALTAPLPRALGGLGIGTTAAGGLDCLNLLRAVGAGNLAVGRVYEGHLNALRLMTRLGTPDQLARAAEEAAAGVLFAVWNTDDGADRLVLVDGMLRGAKILASGAGVVARPIITAGCASADGPRIVLPWLHAGERADLSLWTPQGMRATATGRVDFSGIVVGPDELIGGPGDYLRQPDFSGGAWRASAVAFGGLESLLDAHVAHLRQTGRGMDPHQAARLGQCAIARETARLWLTRAATLGEGEAMGEADDIVAYVNLARLAVEAACLDAMRWVTRAVGLAGLMRPHPIERILRDLSTYLRQPMPDAALMQAASCVLADGMASVRL